MIPASDTTSQELLEEPLVDPAERLKELQQAFLAALDVAESSKGLYKRALSQYFSWLQKQGLKLADITSLEILRYKTYLMERGTSKPDDTSSPVEGRLSSLTVSSYLSAVKRFYSWVESMKYYPDVAKGIRAPKREHKFRRQPLLPDQAKKLLEYYQEKASRDYAIVNLLLRTGLRTIELRRADIQDITFIGSQRVLMIQGKGRSDKEDFVILTDKAYQPIEAYLKTRGISSPEEYLKAPGNKPGSDPLFISESNNSKGSRLTTRKISQIAKEGLKAIDLDNRAFTAHSLRHTTAVNILRAGGTLEDVQLTLRHRSSSTSQIYTHTLNEQRRLANGGEYMIDRLY